MVKVRALQKCFVGNCLRQAGDEFDHDGVINESVMVALEDEAPVKIPKPAKAAKASRKTTSNPPGPRDAVLPGPPKTDS